MDAMSPGRTDHPFFEWCHAKYLGEKSGTAVWVDLPREDAKKLGLFENGNNPARLQGRYPGLNVIITGCTHGNREKAAARFQEILGGDIRAALPGLISGVTDDDPTIRELCREAIRYSGEIAADAVPALKQELYLAASDEIFGIAKALAALGPSGDEVLKEAAACGDPAIHRSAKSALQMHKMEQEAKPTRVARPRLTRRRK